MQELNLQLPQDLYEELHAKAKASRRPLQEIVLQSLRVGMPPNLAHVPSRFRAQLEEMDLLDDDRLRQVGRIDIAEDRASLYELLLEKNQQVELDHDETQTLTELREEADLLMYRRAYAYALLKWRGYPIPQISELSRE